MGRTDIRNLCDDGDGGRRTDDDPLSICADDQKKEQVTAASHQRKYVQLVARKTEEGWRNEAPNICKKEEKRFKLRLTG